MFYQTAVISHATAVLIALAAATCFAGDYDIARSPDGDFKFSISGVVINEGSSLTRESILFNDASCPVQISAHSMGFAYKDRRFVYKGETRTTVSDSMSAVEVRTALYDLFGQHMSNLSNTDAIDIAPGTRVFSGEWRARDNDPAELLTSVTWVARVRLADGTQWVFSEDDLRLALSSLDLENKIEEE